MTYSVQLIDIIIENRITSADIHILRAFQFKHAYFLSLNAFKALPFVFPHNDLPSMDRIKSRVHFLSGLDTAIYDCCVNSCCAFVGNYENDVTCCFCSEPRFLSDGKSARKKYSYSPLIPRLRGLYENKSMCKHLLYRHGYQNAQSSNVDGRIPRSGASSIADIWDGKVYRELRERHIKIDGEELHSKYFSDSHDLALGLSTDGFAPWRRRKYTAWPILVFNYNLPPEVRFHKKNIIPISVVPGPKKPKDFDSFLYPLIQELLELSNSVRAYDTSTGKLFCLQAFLIIAFGDILAISLLLKMKGHNSITSCCICNIHGLRVLGSESFAIIGLVGTALFALW